jgi:hypothetical protein
MCCCQCPDCLCNAASFCMYRWRLHLDVEQSVDLLLASPSELTAALDPYSKLIGAAATAGSAAAAHEASGAPVNTQVRSKDTEGRLWVRFESPGAAEQTLAAAGVVNQLSGGGSGRSVGSW